MSEVRARRRLQRAKLRRGDEAVFVGVVLAKGGLRGKGRGELGASSERARCGRCEIDGEIEPRSSRGRASASVCVWRVRISEAESLPSPLMSCSAMKRDTEA